MTWVYPVEGSLLGGPQMKSLLQMIQYCWGWSQPKLLQWQGTASLSPWQPHKKALKMTLLQPQHICSDSRCALFDTRLLLFFSHVVFMLHVAWELHVTLRYNNNMHTTAALLYVGSKSSTTQTQRERRAWVQSTGSVRKSSGVATYMIEVAHLEEKIYEWGTIFCEIAS